MTSAILFGSFVVLLLLKVPIALCLAVSSILAMIYAGLPLSMIPMSMYAGINKFVLLAIPFFILAGNIMEKSGISTRLIDFADKMVGHRRGGMAIVCVVVACFFAAISGSGPATVAALGVILIPAMSKVGYGNSTSSALMASAGAIGIIIPPSISYVIYGSIAGVSIGKIFVAGFIPGLLMGIALIIAILLVARNKEIVLSPRSSLSEKWFAFKRAVWGLIMPVIILGGIYGGIFTPTEAAAVAVVYGFFVGIFIYKKIELTNIMELFLKTATQSASVMFILACASLFAWVSSTEGISQMASNYILNISGNKYIFLLITNVLLIIVGCFIDANSAMYIFVPILLPVAIQLGYDPIAFGIMMTMNLAIGLTTPPVGVNLYVACQIGEIDLKEISKSVLPFILASTVVLLLITYFPQIYMFTVK